MKSKEEEIKFQDTHRCYQDSVLEILQDKQVVLYSELYEPHRIKIQCSFSIWSSQLHNKLTPRRPSDIL